MKDVHVVGKKMIRNVGKMAKLIGCAFHFETEFILNPSPTHPTALCGEMGFMWKPQRNKDATIKIKSELSSITS